MDPVDIMVEDLARQVAQKSIEVAQWKARAISTEAALAEIQKAHEPVETDEGVVRDFSVVPDIEEEEDGVN